MNQFHPIRSSIPLNCIISMLRSKKRKKLFTIWHAHRGVTRLDGARSKKQVWRPRDRTGAPMVKPELFRKQLYCIEESSCDIVGTFRRLPQYFGAPAVIQRAHSELAPGKLCPPYPLVTPLHTHLIYISLHKQFIHLLPIKSTIKF